MALALSLWIAEQLVVLVLLFPGDGGLLFRVGLGLDFLAVENAHRSVGAHHGNFRRRPGVIDVASQLLAAHHDMRAAVALPEGYGYLGYRGLAVGVEELCAICDDGTVFLLGAAEEAGNVNQGEQWNVECIAEACGKSSEY